jgi:sulfur-oxidizing protein SoxX
MNGVRVLVFCGLIMACWAVQAQGQASGAESTADDTVRLGREAAFNRQRGNCLACHAMGDGEMAGLVGPPLMMMQQRFPDPDVLRQQIWDATERNPNTRMPPFGRHGMLSEEEIDWIVDYLYTL